MSDTLPNGAGADITNWRDAPHSAWAFHHVDQVVPCAPIAHDPGRVQPLRRASQEFGASVLTPEFLEATSTDAVVVLRDGEIVFERYAKGNDARSPHILMSASKAVTGLLVGILAARGDLDAHASVTRYLPQLAQTPYGAATLRDLLDMRSGVRPEGEALEAYDAAVNWDPDRAGAAPIDLRGFFETYSGLVAKPGGPFAYISANTDLAGWVVEQATGETIAALLGKHLWKPMGAERDGAVTLDRGGLARCAGGVCATARDFARIGQLVVDGGAADGVQVAPAALIDDLCDNGDAEAWRTGEWGEVFAPISRNFRYRGGWYSVGDDPKHLFAMGIHGQNLFIDRARRLVMAKFSSWPQRIEYGPLLRTHTAFGELQRAAAG